MCSDIKIHRTTVRCDHDLFFKIDRELIANKTTHLVEQTRNL